MKHKETIWKYRGMPIGRKYCPVQGKNIYDKRGAQTEANRRWEEDHVELRIYNCPECNGWHLTKQI